MILAWAVVLGLIIALIRHGRQAFSCIAAINIRYAWLVLLTVVMQIPLLMTAAGPTEEIQIQQWLFILSHILLLAFVWLNRHLTGILIVGVGVLLNLVVILANGGWMPIAPVTLVSINPGTTLAQWQEGLHYAYSKDIILSAQSSRLWIMSDIFVLGPPFPLPTAFSIGDLVIGLGIIILLAIAGPDEK